MKRNRIFKILILVDHARGVDGPHRNVVNTLNSLALLEFVEVTLLTGNIDSTEKYIYSDNIKIINFFNPKDLRKIITNYFYVFKNIRKHDIIYVPTNLTSWLYAFCAGASFKKFIAGPNVAGIPFLMPIHNPNKIMTTYFLNKWIENSEVRKDLCLKAGTPLKQIKVIPHSIDIDEFNPNKKDSTVWEKYNLNPKRLKLLHVGRSNEKIKATKELVEVFKKLNIKNEYDLIYVGIKGKYWDESYDKVPGVHYLGQIYGDELKKIYASSDIFFALSYSESFWYTPLEAMSSGLPVLVNNVGAVPTFIPTSKKEGIVVNIIDNSEKKFREDYQSIVLKNLRTLIKDEALRKKISISARNHIQNNFSYTVMANRFYSLFNELYQKEIKD